MPSANKILVVGGIALFVYFVVAVIQQRVMPIPLIGGQLPR
jgi:hypothetical protein